MGFMGMGEVAMEKAFPMNLQSCIGVAPSVAGDDVPRVYAEHDVFVFPSMLESMSLVVPEAMASGMPIMTTRACGMQDIIEDGVAGFVVAPRDSERLANRLALLLDNPSLGVELKRAARQKAREITRHQIAKQTIAVYEKLLRE